VSEDQKSLPREITELWELVVAYAKQETVEPVRNLGRFVAFGLAGSLVLGLGLVLLVLAALRVLQTETGSHLQHHWSWLPYAIMFVVCLAIAGAAMAGWSRTRNRGKEVQ
jgi:hypothetical protein